MPDLLLPSTLITRVDGLLATEVDDETVLMHVEHGQYYGLARTAHAIWLLLEAPQTFEQLCAALNQRYADSADTARGLLERMGQRAGVAAIPLPSTPRNTVSGTDGVAPGVNQRCRPGEEVEPVFVQAPQLWLAPTAFVGQLMLALMFVTLATHRSTIMKVL